MRKIFNKLVCILCLLSLFSCAPKESSLSLQNSSVTQEEIETVIKGLANKYENIEKLRFSTTDFSLSAFAKYKQTIHNEEYGIEIKDSDMDISVNNLKNENIKIFLNTSGSFKTYTLITNRGVKDEEESKEFNFTFNDESIFLDKSSMYVSLSKEMHAKILEDDSIIDGIKVYKDFSLDDINKDDIQDNINSIMNTSNFINPGDLLSSLFNQALLKKYLKTNKIKDIYEIGLSLNKNDLYTLINDYMNSYASKINLPDETSFSLNIRFTNEKVINLVIKSNVEAEVKFESLGNVNFTYLADGIINYLDDSYPVDSFIKSNDYVEYNETILPLKKFYDNSLSDIRTIYLQIVSLFIK